MGALMGDAETLIQTALLGEAVDAGPALIFIADEEMRYVAVNEWVASRLASSREEILGSRVGDHNQTDGARSAIESILQRVPARGRTQIGEGLVEWIVVETRLAGLPHFFGVMWPAS